MRLPGFYKLPYRERRARIKELTGVELTDITPEVLDHLTENVVGAFCLPFSVAVNFKINGDWRLIPMVIEEPSVVAAASNGAKYTLPDGFEAGASDQVMIGQVYYRGPDPDENEVARVVNESMPGMVGRGGGYRGMRIRDLGEWKSLDVFIDVRDAQGANTINRAMEKVADLLEETLAHILSNFAEERMAWARAKFKVEEETARRIVELVRLAHKDPYRRTTHVKGIANGIGALALATGNDWRATLAGMFTWAFEYGDALTQFRWTGEYLEGSIRLPLQMGTVGGTIRAHPQARQALKLLGVRTAKELNAIAAALGLAQNFAAVRAIVKEGINAGHMRLHARQIALTLGVSPEKIDAAVNLIVQNRAFTPEAAQRLLKEKGVLS